VDHVENDKCPKINVQEVRDERLRKALLGKKLGVQHSFGDFLIPHEQLATVEPIRHQHDDKDLLTYGEDVASEMALSVKESEVEPVEEPVPPQNPLPPHLRKDVKADHWLKRRAEMALSQSDRDGNTTDVEHGDDEELSDASDEDGYDWKALASRIKFLGPESSVFSSPAKSVIDSGESVGDELSVAKGTAESLDIAYSYKGKSQPEGVLSNVDPNLAANTAAINVSDPWEQWNADQKDLLARFDPDSPSFDPKLFYLEHVNEYLCSKCR
jgi:hypothetical protein